MNDKREKHNNKWTNFLSDRSTVNMYKNFSITTMFFSALQWVYINLQTELQKEVWKHQEDSVMILAS
jgi:hypothetical protein